MVRILNEIEEDTTEVMNHHGDGSNSLDVDITSKSENPVRDQNGLNGKAKNRNNNCMNNNKIVTTPTTATATLVHDKSGGYSDVSLSPFHELDSSTATTTVCDSPSSSPPQVTIQSPTNHKKCVIDNGGCDKEENEVDEARKSPPPPPSSTVVVVDHQNQNGTGKHGELDIDFVAESLQENETDKTNDPHNKKKDNHASNPVIIIEHVDDDDECSSFSTDKGESPSSSCSSSNSNHDDHHQKTGVGDNSRMASTTEQTPGGGGGEGTTTKLDSSKTRTDGQLPSAGTKNTASTHSEKDEGTTTATTTSTTSVRSTDSSPTIKKDAPVSSSSSSSLPIPGNKSNRFSSPGHIHHFHHHAHHNHLNHFNHMPNQHGHIQPHLHQVNSQHNNTIPGVHVSQPVDGRGCIFGNGPGSNIPGFPGHPQPPVPFNFYGDPKFESMNCGGFHQFPPQPSIPPPPCGGGGPQIPPAPLPTALFPLPLDPNCPPAVLPSHPIVTNSNGGGYSRSSSPMMMTNPSSSQSQGQALMAVEPVATSCLPPTNAALLPNPSPAGHNSNSMNGHNPNPNPNVVFSASSSDIVAVYPHFPVVPGQYVVFFHINPGVLVSFHVGGDHIQIIKGPMTVPLVSSNSNPPIPLPMQVPQGHVVQQIVDENGTLRHVIVSHQPPLMPIPFGPGNQSQPFYPPGPGFPGHFPPMQTGVCGMPPSTQPGPPTPPGPNSLNSGAYVGHLPAHKDERTQRQFVKLRRKFEIKQRDREMPSFNQTSYYHQNGANRKAETGGYNNNNNNNNNNNQRRNVPISNGTLKSSNGGGVEEEGSVGSTGSVTSTGTQEEEEESRVVQAQTEMLSALIPPVISDVASHSALIQWSHPDRFTESGENKFPDIDVSDTDFRYDVHISDKSRDNRFKSIFIGSALSCRVKDLKPGTLYAISYCSLLNDVRGSMSTATNFTTLPDVPDAPPSPRAISRSRSSIQFKWSPPVNDNGSKVTSYILEYDEGKGGSHFVETYRGKNKQSTVAKLQPAYSYQFRLAAVNQCGQSRYSSTVTVMTAGSPPSQPAPPRLKEAGVTYLTLEWNCRPSDDEYTLQMEDPSTGHGFLCVYNGNAPHYTYIALTRNTEYKFRVKAQNEEGHSKWSEEVTFRTMPAHPGPPHKPGLKGKVHANSFKLGWKKPTDDGGVPITAYALEIDQGNGFEEIYRGIETEYNVDKLSPGQSYALRVIAEGPGGESPPSEACVITTEPVCPGKCDSVVLRGKPKSNSVHLKWSPPDWDGGSPVNQFEVCCTTPDNQTQEAYRGKETDCNVRVLPGRAYLFQIRAFNRIGAGPWSDPLEVVSGAGSPDVPLPVKVQTKTAHMVILSWAEPLNNGSAITEYRVQMATLAIEQPAVEEESMSGQEEGEDLTEEKQSEDDPSSPPAPLPTPPPKTAAPSPTNFCQVYLGSALSCEVKALEPASVYLFRVQAANNAGTSEWSPVTTHQMPASSPSIVSSVEASASTDSISLSWKNPASNGAPISHYNVSVGEAVFVTTTNSYVVDNLMADAQYKIRVQAVNGVGPGPYSSVVKISTKPLPPPPPKLECVSTAHFWMKLKWSETNKNIEYLVQMISPYQDEFQVVYRGSNCNFKVTRLAEDTQYLFRICALNRSGQGPFSDMYRFTTLKAPPPQVKGLKVEQAKENELYKIEWLEVTCADPVTYQLQLAKRRDQEFKVIFRGDEKRFDLTSENLEEGVEYTARVCAIRQCDAGQLIGPYCNPVNFLVPLSTLSDSDSAKNNSSLSKNLSSCSQSSTFLQVVQEKMSHISYESRVGIVAVFALIFLAFVISLITHHVVS